MKSTPITKPILPPLKGYVEVEIDGIRGYKNVKTGVLITQEKLDEPTDIEILQEENKTLKAKVTALTESNQFLEDCIVELAEVIYA